MSLNGGFAPKPHLLFACAKSKQKHPRSCAASGYIARWPVETVRRTMVRISEFCAYGFAVLITCAYEVSLSAGVVLF
ncbi:MAG: hypothetical protein FWH20_00660 [Oscillospiraceae bacterium]|nr:hypothetical protein [Oscillospiraceae bacterium]